MGQNLLPTLCTAALLSAGCQPHIAQVEYVEVPKEAPYLAAKSDEVIYVDLSQNNPCAARQQVDTPVDQAPCQRYAEKQQVEFVDQAYHHRYGLEVEPAHWFQSGCSGQVVTTLRDGVNISQTFAQGMLNGESTYSYPNSTQIQRREVYNNDVLTSETHYAHSGVPTFTRDFSAPEIWSETHWYETAQPKSIEKYERGLLIMGDYYDMSNQRDSWVYDGVGERISRDEWGNVASLDEFRGGELAQVTTYHPNRSISEIIPYAQGKLHGERKSYYPGGDPMAIESWFEGERTGVTKIFQNGEKCAEIPYVSGKKHGTERKFRDGAIISQEINWVNDKMHGPTYTYVGDNVQTDWFYQGRLTSRSNFESFAMPRRPMLSN